MKIFKLKLNKKINLIMKIIIPFLIIISTSGYFFYTQNKIT